MLQCHIQNNQVFLLLLLANYIYLRLPLIPDGLPIDLLDIELDGLVDGRADDGLWVDLDGIVDACPDDGRSIG